MGIEVKGVAHVGLYIKDIERSKKFYKEICLAEQAFIKDGDISVSTYVKNAGGEITSFKNSATLSISTPENAITNFGPIYLTNIYSGEIDCFTISLTIISVVKTIDSQEIIENIVRDDMFTGLKSAEYLYAEGKRRLDKYTISSICMFEITNIINVNEQYVRHTGNDVINLYHFHLLALILSILLIFLLHLLMRFLYNK